MKNKKVKYSESDMAALIKQVEDEFAQHLAKAEESVEEVEEATAAPAEEAVSEETSEQEAPEALAKAEEEVEEPASEEELDYDEKDFAEMDELYASMSKSEAEAHMKSLQKALKVEAEEVVEEVSEEEGKIAKSEEEGESLQKSELKAKDEEIEKLKENNQKLEKSLQDLTTAMTKFVKRAPKQKAVTQIQYVAKSEDKVEGEKKEEDVAKLSKSEISQRLTAKIRDGKLEKSDREKINAYYLDGNKDIESIKHLL